MPTTARNQDDLQPAWTALQQGEAWGCEVLFKSCYPALFGYGLKLVDDRELVRDAIQDLFATLWHKRAQLSDAASVEAYLLSALRRRLLRAVERRRRRREVSDRVAPLASVTFTFEELIVRMETTEAQKRALLTSLNALSPRQREVVYLRYYNGLTNDEIAQVLALENQTVRNHLTRALGRLRAHCRRLAGEELATLLLLTLRGLSS